MNYNVPLLKELVSLLRENNELLRNISAKLDNLVEPTWEPPPAVMPGTKHINMRGEEHPYNQVWSPSGYCCVCELGDGTEGCTT